MLDLTKFLSDAHEQGIVSAKQVDELTRLWQGQQHTNAEPGDGLLADLSNPAHFEDGRQSEPSESPRLVRGFHDVLISIGIIAALGGLWVLGSVFAVLPAIIVLAELFVHRQKLALPGFVLTLALAQSVAILPLSASQGNGDTWPFILLFAVEVIALLAFYWRYRVPVALAWVIASGFLLAFFLLLGAFTQLSGVASIDQLNSQIIGLTGLVLSGVLFAIAMRFDLADRKRQTRRSDVAFWLHLGTAPLLLYSMFAAVFDQNGFWWADEPQAFDAAIAVVMIAILILIGIVIDRRAFVTSGLISLGVALYILTENTLTNATNVTALSFLAVGVIVLALGTGWQTLRKVIVSRLPHNWQEALPPTG